MNIRDLSYLVALADFGHFGKAADASCVSQPALSMQIKKLEKYLGIQLLERTNKSVSLTDNGFVIAERARHILQQVTEIREIAKLAQDPLAGELRLGIFPTLAPYLLPLLIPALAQAFPKLSFYLIEEKTPVLIEKLQQRKIHAAFLALPLNEKQLQTALLFEEEFLLALPNHHQLAKQKFVKQTDLQNKDLLLLEEGHCMRNQALAICHLMNASESQRFRATSLETLRHMVTANVGITLMPKLACQNDVLTYIPFSDPKPTRSIGLVWKNSSAKQILLQTLAEKIKSILAQDTNLKIL